jgi:hypothetical protein
MPGGESDGDYVSGSGEAKRDSGAGAPEEINPGDQRGFIEPDIAIEDFPARDFDRGGERQRVVGPENVRVAEARGDYDEGDQ